MTFKDLDEFFDASLVLPIRGRDYRVPSPDGETGLWVQRLIAMQTRAASGKEISDEQASRLELDDDEERTLYERLLGSAMDEMLDDGIPWEWIKHAGMTAMLWVGISTDAAERYWNAGGNPEAQAPNRETKRAAARSTRRRGSASGTTPRPRVIRGEVADTPGETSSATGT